MQGYNNGDVFEKLPLRGFIRPTSSLTLGVCDPVESMMDIRPGMVSVFTMLGTDSARWRMIALISARATMIKLDSNKKRTMTIIYPSSLQWFLEFKEALEYYMASKGNKHAEIKFAPVRSMDDVMKILDENMETDIIINLYAGFFIESTKMLHDYMNKLNDIKREKVIILFRYNRKRVSMTRNAEREVIIDITGERAYWYNRGRHVIKLNLESSHRIEYTMIGFDIKLNGATDEVRSTGSTLFPWA